LGVPTHAPSLEPQVSADGVDVLLSPVVWARSLVKLDPEAVDSDINGLAVGVRGDEGAAEKARF
jgi:hypothetical protein